MKIGIFSAFVRGWYAALGLRGLVLLKWIVNLACGFFAILPFWFLMADQWDESLINDSLFSAMPIDNLVEMSVENWDQITVYIWVLLPILVFFVMANLFMSAGIIQAIHSKKKPSWPEFFSSCSRYFFSMVRIALLCLLLLALVVLLPNALLGKVVESIRERATGPMPVLIARWVQALLVILLLSGVMRIYDYSRILVWKDKKAWRSFKQAIGFVHRNRFRTFGLWFLFMVCSLGSGLAYAKLDPVVVTSYLTLLLSFLLGQVLLLFKSTTSIAFLAGQQRFMAHRLEPTTPEHDAPLEPDAPETDTVDLETAEPETTEPEITEMTTPQPATPQPATGPFSETLFEPVQPTPEQDQDTQYLPPKEDEKKGSDQAI